MPHFSRVSRSGAFPEPYAVQDFALVNVVRSRIFIFDTMICPAYL